MPYKVTPAEHVGVGVGVPAVAVAVAVGVNVAVAVDVGVNVAVAVDVGVNVAVAVDVDVGVNVAVAVAVAVDVAVAVGVGETAGQAPGSEKTTLSILQPTPAVLLSLPMRQRSTRFCPAAADGRFTVVVIKPADTPPHAARPPSGFACVASMVALYPPVTKLPPAVMISVKAPPPMLISSTAPSKKVVVPSNE